MKRNTSIQLKAAFLLVVFALNTLVGFACSVGVDMGFNTKHHPEAETEAVVHIHKDGKKHIHHEKKEKHKHENSHKHASDEEHQHHQKDHNKQESDKENCCSDKVKEFAVVDKSLPQSINLSINQFFTDFFSAVYQQNVLVHSQFEPNVKHFVRSYHPPIPDIRIAIQSFQI